MIFCMNDFQDHRSQVKKWPLSRAMALPFVPAQLQFGVDFEQEDWNDPGDPGGQQQWFASLLQCKPCLRGKPSWGRAGGRSHLCGGKTSLRGASHFERGGG